MLTNGQIQQNRHKHEAETLAKLVVPVDAVLQHDADVSVNQHLLDFCCRYANTRIPTIKANHKYLRADIGLTRQSGQKQSRRPHLRLPSLSPVII